MLLSMLIKELQEIEATNGDIEVLWSDGSIGSEKNMSLSLVDEDDDCDPITPVLYVEPRD